MCKCHSSAYCYCNNKGDAWVVASDVYGRNHQGTTDRVKDRILLKDVSVLRTSHIWCMVSGIHIVRAVK
eukprot:8305415-Pyramimonas_sp.AAC.1